jgi:O-antigen/teichoic acid export membrane protein
MRAFFRSNSLIVVGETVALSLLLLLNFSLLSRFVDAQVLGLWFLLTSLFAYTRIVDFWSNGLASFVAEALGHNRREAALEFVGTALLTGVVGHGAVTVMATATLWWLTPWLADAGYTATIRQALPVMAVGFWLAGVASTFHPGLLGFGRPFLKACQTVGGALVFAVAIVVLAPQYGLVGILVSQVMQAAAMLLFGLITFSLAVAGSPRFLRWNRWQFRSLAVFGGKTIVLGSMQLSIEPIIRMLANHFGGLAAVTVVELASRLIATVRNLIVSLGQVLVPAFARLAASDVTASRRLYGEVRALYVLASVPAFGVLISVAPLAEVVLLGREGTGFATFLGLLSIGWIANTLCAPAYFLMLSQRRLLPLMLPNVIMSVGAIALGAALGSVAGVVGALAGSALAIVAASVYLDRSAAVDGAALFQLVPTLAGEPRLVGAILAASAVPPTLALGETLRLNSSLQIGLGAVAAVTVLLCSARPCQLRNLLALAGRLG